MPAKNSLKVYAPNSYYHVYNRGVNKQAIFEDEQDYGVFLSYLKTYLLPRDERALQEQLADPRLSYKEKNKIVRILRLNNFSSEITLISYCLMPNHFHFLLKQTEPTSIDRFMNSLGTRYTMYFNKRYKRVGPLYQNVYKAVLVESEEQLLYLTSYIHRNPIKKLALKGDAFRAAILKQPSSYLEYLEERKTDWVHPKEVINFFSRKNPRLSYQSFVEQASDYSPIETVAIDL